RNAPPLPLGCDRGLSTLGNDCNLLGSVHLPSKWTPIRSVHFDENGPHLWGCPDGHRRTLTNQPHLKNFSGRRGIGRPWRIWLGLTSGVKRRSMRAKSSELERFQVKIKRPQFSIRSIP